MRQVFTPPPDRSGPVIPILGGLLLTLLVFLVLPLTQMVSSGVHRQLVLSKLDTATLKAPESEPEPPPPPPEDEPPEEPPPPTLSDAPPPMNLSIDLDVAVGMGGALAMGSGLAAPDGSGNLMDAFDVAELEKRPEVLASVAPVYPTDLRKARVEGLVTVVFVLDETGRVQDPRVEASSRLEFEKPALEALRRWKFRPGMKEGTAVRTFMRLPFRFRMQS